jgi:hypothetical protein
MAERNEETIPDPLSAAEAERCGVVSSRYRVHVWKSRGMVTPVLYEGRIPRFNRLDLERLERKANDDARSGKRGPRAA